MRRTSQRMVAGKDRRLQWLERGRLLWRKAFMEEGAFIFFVKALFWKLCNGGRKIERTLREREGAWREMRDGGGRRRSTLKELRSHGLSGMNST